MQEDNFDKAIERLKHITVLLYGGHYEPKSDRDVQLALDIQRLLVKHGCVEENS
jgi:hypothetical protein